MLGPLLLALDGGAVLLVDELDASLHPRFAAEVVRLFHDPLANPNGAQLVFTSHDPSVLTTPSGGRLLEPGQVWLTEKDKDGATELYPLTAASPGEDEDLMKSYLAGAFGAVPSLMEGQIARRRCACQADSLEQSGRRAGQDNTPGPGEGPGACDAAAAGSPAVPARHSLVMRTGRAGSRRRAAG